ncbi:unnamed protein product [Hyaloperonospora brassicae]|uniref:RxLR effector candidate protein n=1 Tax=Hyaloperonospora brassicae TaxID=162125 RepID=A0AAV0TQ72_HYABA|nr:unnamed protein product [Hyaloperonospora brassicae]
MTRMHQNKKPKPSPAAASAYHHIDTSEWPAFPVSTIISSVCRVRLHGQSEGDDVLRLIDSFLTTPFDSLTLLKAYQRSGGSLRLLQYLAVRELRIENPSRHLWEVNVVTRQMAARGDLQSLKWIIKTLLPGDFVMTDIVYQVSANGHICVLQWLWENHRDMGHWGGDELCGAISNRHSTVVEWLKTRVVVRPEFAHCIVQEAVASGNLEIVQWLHERFRVALVDAVKTAARRGEWTIVRWILDNGKPADRKAALSCDALYASAARVGNIDMLQLLFDRGLPRKPVFVLESAILGGHLHAVKWLHEEKGITNVVAGYVRAARRGQLDMLTYLFENKVIATPYLFPIDAAAAAGHLEVVQWLHRHTETKCTELAMAEAAGKGYLHIVQWLHANRSEGCSHLAMDCAARYGHLDVVKWLYANSTEGCSRIAMEDSAWYGNSDVVKQLRNDEKT